MRSEQLLLSLRPRPTVSFDSFLIEPGNAPAVHALRTWLDALEGGVFSLAGASGSGRSHLLQAACAHVSGAVYLPLAELQALSPAPLFEGLEHAPLLALDDIDAVSADPAWCEALFHCFNAQVGAGGIGAGKWLVSARVPPMQLDCALADLRSRLGWGGSFHLASLDDEGRRRMLQLHARQRGMELSDELAAYILQRFSRDTAALLGLLERIDRESLYSKQRVSTQLVRKLLSDTAIDS